MHHRYGKSYMMKVWILIIFSICRLLNWVAAIIMFNYARGFFYIIRFFITYSSMVSQNSTGMELTVAKISTCGLLIIPTEPLLSSFQCRFSVNIWCGLIGDLLTGSFVLEHFAPANYVYLLKNTFLLLMGNMPLEKRLKIFFQHDENQWISNADAIHWPLRSPDIILLDSSYGVLWWR